MAADVAHDLKVMEQQAEKINIGSIGKIKLSPTKILSVNSKKQRLLRTSVGAILGAVVVLQTQPKSPPKSTGARGLLNEPPNSSPPPTNTTSAGVVSYSSADLEQKGWEILSHALSTSSSVQLQDFRNKRGVGADGTIDWKTFF